MLLTDLFSNLFGNSQTPQLLNNLQPNGQPLTNNQWGQQMAQIDPTTSFMDKLSGYAAGLPGGNPNFVPSGYAQQANGAAQPPTGGGDMLRQQLLMQAMQNNQNQQQMQQPNAHAPMPMGGMPNRFGAVPQQQMNPMQASMMIPQRNRFIGG
jgi:hypothetical protein